MADMESKNGIQNNSTQTQTAIRRRPDIDLIRIVLTWSILLYHTVQIYLPQIGFFVGIHSESQEGLVMAGVGFIISMNVWNMPMFFFLSGIRFSREHSQSMSHIYICIKEVKNVNRGAKN